MNNYTQEEIMIELTKRMTDKALEFAVSLGTGISFKEFEEEWKKAYPTQSYFKSGYVSSTSTQ